MNERIKELAEQASLELFNDTAHHRLLKGFAEKFAELIVFECVKAVMDGTMAGDHYAQRIEQHFDNGMYPRTLTVNDIKERFGI